MSGFKVVNLGNPVLLEFRGPDAVRFLNGQLTQDTRLVAGGKNSLPSCVTDAKGKLQFRVHLTEAGDGALWVSGPADSCAGLEARLTRYLIADDVEASDLTGGFALFHLIGPAPAPPAGIVARVSNRFGADGTDWWVPAGSESGIPAGAQPLAGDDLEAFRIDRGAPAWGRELTEGLLPPEAGLDATDISYQKGCYIGQEVISRIKSAGKLNKRLVRMTLAADAPADAVELVDADGNPAGSLTSVSPHADAGTRHALGFVKRGAAGVFVLDAAGNRHPVAMI